jgi:hypothetical protein
MMMMKLFTMGLLLSAAGEGGGAGGAPAPAGQQPAAPQQPGTAPQPGAPPPSNGAVTREEFNALNGKIDKLIALGSSAPAPGPAAPAPGPAAPPASGPSPDMPDWAKAINNKLDALGQKQTEAELGERKRQLVSAVLEGVPEANRGLASLALEGLMTTTGVRLDQPGVDVNALAQQLGATLRTQHQSLFAVQGSTYSAIPKGSDGKYDFSAVNSLAEVPPDLMRFIPDPIYARLRDGLPAQGSQRNGEFRPVNRFSN